jgi:CheY-like chemotaxis protein
MAAGRGVRVLVVDDCVDLAMSLKMLLKMMGHEVQIAHDGPGALAAYQTHQPDVILLDIGMPGMNGYEIVRRLRREQGARHPLVVAVSGYGQDEDKRKAREAGFDTFLTKPVHPKDLAELLASEKALAGSDGRGAGQSI